MLSRQWQTGEFEGDDAGSPIFTKIQMATTAVTRYQPANHAPENFLEETPLETKVEALAIPWVIENRPISLDLRLQMGRQWLKLLGALAAPYAAAFADHYKID